MIMNSSNTVCMIITGVTPKDAALDRLASKPGRPRILRTIKIALQILLLSDFV
jgi:hypothetical protein